MVVHNLDTGLSLGVHLSILLTKSQISSEKENNDNKKKGFWFISIVESHRTVVTREVK